MFALAVTGVACNGIFGIDEPLPLGDSRAGNAGTGGSAGQASGGSAGKGGNAGTSGAAGSSAAAGTASIGGASGTSGTSGGAGVVGRGGDAGSGGSSGLGGGAGTTGGAGSDAVGGGGTTGGEGESGAAGTGESGGSGGEGGTPEPIDRCLDPALRGPALVAIPAGTATIGAEDLNEYTIPVHDVPLAAYCIDRTEVTVAHYRECVEGTVAGCAPPDLTFGDCNWEMPDNDAHPVSCIDWPRADAYCRWAGKRLPTEAEWEHVANQGTGALYPWGDEPADPALGNFFNSVATTTVVGSYPDGATPTGVFDLAGNVWEWTGDAFCEDYSPGATCDTNNHAARGGSFASASEDFVRAAYRDPDSDGSGRFGFRCALSH